jgi:hypothetical protein
MRKVGGSTRWGALALLIPLMTACGGGSGSVTTTPPPPPPATLSITVSPPTASIDVGQSLIVEVSLTSTNYFGTVDLSITGLPTGVTCFLGCSSTVPSTGLEVTLVASSSAALGASTITFTALAGTTKSSAPLPLTITTPPQTPTIAWAGDPLVTNNAGDNGISTTYAQAGVMTTPDGVGGVLVAWDDDFNGTAFVQRLDNTGSPMWPQPGVPVAPVSPFQTNIVSVGDGAGGVIAAWVDGRAGFCDYGFKGNCDIYAQRFDANGNALWQADGIPVVTAPENQGVEGISIISDGIGGAFLAWEDDRSGAAAMYVQHLTTSGQSVWMTDGVPVSPTQNGVPMPPVLTNAEAGNVIVTWMNIYVNLGQQPSVNVQKVSDQGQLLWNSVGVPVSFHTVDFEQSLALEYFTAASDGAGGVIVVAVDNRNGNPVQRGVVAQRVDTTGQNAWPAGGVAVSPTSTDTTPVVLADGSGGVFVAWRHCDPFAYQNCDILGQRIDASGQMQWRQTGVSVSSAPGPQLGQQMVSDGSGGIIVAWDDCRGEPDPTQIYTCFAQMDLYAQRLNGQGQTYWQGDGFPISIAPGNQGVPFSYEYIYSSFALSPDGKGGIFLAWPDGRDSLCGAADPQGSSCELRAQHLLP